MSNDLLMVIIRVCIFAVLSFTSFAFVKWVKPWLETNNLTVAAKIAVQAAQALYGRYNGEKKLQAALQSLNQKGFNIQAEQVIQAVRAAWQELDISQIIAGIKQIN